MTAFTFTGCTAKPYKIEWHLSAYYADEELYGHYVGFDWYDHFNSAFSDAAEISFEKDGSFYFKDKDGVEYNGTYTSKKSRYYSDVFLTLADGSKFEGWGFGCRTNRGRAYSLSFEFNGVKYYFDSEEDKFDEEDLNNHLIKVANAVNTFAYGGNASEEDYEYFATLQYAVIGKVDGKYVAVTEDSAYLLIDLNYWCYYVNGTEIREDELREGKCIIRAGYNRVAIYYPAINT